MAVTRLSIWSFGIPIWVSRRPLAGSMKIRV
jgi:hypothetical protein